LNYLSTHIRIVTAFVIREIATRYGRSPGGYIWALLEPIAFIALMSSLMGSLGRLPAQGDSFTLFYATGYLAFSMYKGMERYLVSAIAGNRGLMSYPKVSPFDAIVARLVLQGMTSCVVTAVIIYGAMWTTSQPIEIHWLQIVGAIAFAWILALGVAMGNTVLFFKFPLYQKIFDIVMRPLFLLSGVFYVPSHMPHPFSDVLLANPVTQVVVLFRQGFYIQHGDTGFDMAYLITVSGALLFVGMALFTFIPVARARES
jgi:capsular polysaccharide transport system permease protein